MNVQIAIVCYWCEASVTLTSDVHIEDGDRSWLTYRCGSCELVSYLVFDWEDDYAA